MGLIESVSVDLEGGYGEDGTKVKAYLHLTGDFVDECDRYLSNEKESTMHLELLRSAADELYAALRNAFYGQST